jgi:hypothetical protein
MGEVVPTTNAENAKRRKTCGPPFRANGHQTVYYLICRPVTSGGHDRVALSRTGSSGCKLYGVPRPFRKEKMRIKASAGERFLNHGKHFTRLALTGYRVVDDSYATHGTSAKKN